MLSDSQLNVYIVGDNLSHLTGTEYHVSYLFSSVEDRGAPWKTAGLAFSSAFNFP